MHANSIHVVDPHAAAAPDHEPTTLEEALAALRKAREARDLYKEAAKASTTDLFSILGPYIRGDSQGVMHALEDLADTRIVVVGGPSPARQH